MEQMEIFVVDGSLEIHPVKIAEADWRHPSGVFSAYIGDQSIIVLRGGWNKFTTYGGFKTKEEAENFKAKQQG